MSPTLDGPPFCPRCGYQEATGADAEADLDSHTMLYDASDFDLREEYAGDAAATNVMRAVGSPARPAKGRRKRVPGESIFDSEIRIEPGPEERTPGQPLEVAPDGQDVFVDQSSATADLPRVYEPGDGARQRPGTKPIIQRRGDVAPPREEAFFLPRCKYCEQPLELEEVAAGVCRKCRREHSGWRRDVTLVRVAQVTAGTLAACEVLWVGALVLSAAARSGFGERQFTDILTPALRGGLVVFAALAAVAFARGRDWGAGAAVALGPVAAVLALLQLRSGELSSAQLTTAAAWLGAGAAGGLVTAVAVTCFGPGNVFSQASLIADSRRRRSARMRKSGRSGRYSSESEETGGGGGDTSQGKGRAIVGGITALAGAGLAGWLTVLALSAGTEGGGVALSPGTFLSVPQEVPLVSAGLLGAAAVAAAALGVLLLLKPPAESTHAAAVAGAAVAGALPAWLFLGTFLSGGKLVRPLAIVSGAVRLIGAESMVLIPRATSTSMTPDILALGAAGSVAAAAAGLWTIFGGAPVRGRALAGFALAWAVVWGSGLVAAASA